MGIKLNKKVMAGNLLTVLSLCRFGMPKTNFTFFWLLIEQRRDAAFRPLINSMTIDELAAGQGNIEETSFTPRIYYARSYGCT